ncbi:MAG: RluA family pseudouridine synthase [Acidimicrobiia bacterium]|nr:RluA family pseudouridine synthase [Acidimicrobiia bacterium]
MSEMLREEIPESLVGERLDRVVSLVADVSRRDAAVMIEAGGVRLDGSVVASGKVRLNLGQVVEIDTSTRPTVELPGPDESIDVVVLHEDDHVIVVDKAPGVVVHPAAGHHGGTLVNGLLARYPEIASVGDPERPGIVHRLDVGTSGLLVVARTNEAYHSLVEQLSEHDVERRYIALAWGHFDAPSGTIDAPIGRDPRDPLRMAVVPTGKEARTHYHVERTLSDPDASLVICELETGRTHQIRVHLAAVGHPVVGDATYGGQRAGWSTERPVLHATRLTFRHPVTGDEIGVDSPLPDDLVAVLGRWS